MDEGRKMDGRDDEKAATWSHRRACTPLETSLSTCSLLSLWCCCTVVDGVACVVLLHGC